MSVSPPRKILFASLIGSVVEWYDLFVYGSLIIILQSVFFSSSIGGVPSIIPAIGAFVAGAAVRPAGGAIFGRFGDLLGRRFAFVLTTVIMGIGSVIIGILPTYREVGVLAPIALVSVRIIQGLALGGEYAGGVIFVAENCSDAQRGRWTSFVQLAPTLGLFLSFATIIPIELALGPAQFHDWGWRIPFLSSAVLLVVAIAIRWKLGETILFSALRNLKKTSNSPLAETILRKSNVKPLILALTVVSGASVVWHTVQFYTSIFMQNTLKVDFLTSAIVMLIALGLGAPFFVVFGRLSDKVGRLKIMLTGTILAACSFYPVHYAMSQFSHPPNIIALTGLTFVGVLLSAMCYGPLGAFLVEYFPSRIRYTSMSISHGVGTGIIGDGTLVIAPVLVLIAGNIYEGLVWSIAVPIIAAAISLILVKESKATNIWLEVSKQW